MYTQILIKRRSKIGLALTGLLLLSTQPAVAEFNGLQIGALLGGAQGMAEYSLTSDANTHVGAVAGAGGVPAILGAAFNGGVPNTMKKK